MHNTNNSIKKDLSGGLPSLLNLGIEIYVLYDAFLYMPSVILSPFFSGRDKEGNPHRLYFSLLGEDLASLLSRRTNSTYQSLLCMQRNAMQRLEHPPTRKPPLCKNNSDND